MNLMQLGVNFSRSYLITDNEEQRTMTSAQLISPSMLKILDAMNTMT